jgi:hypothetical protein
MLLVKGIAMMVVKAGTASVASCQLMSKMLLMKITAPIRHSTGPVAMAGIEENSGLCGSKQTRAERRQGTEWGRSRAVVGGQGNSQAAGYERQLT